MEMNRQEEVIGSSLSDEQQEEIGLLVRKVVAGEGLAGVFNVENGYLQNVEQRAYQFYKNKRYEDARTLCLGVISLAPERYYPYLLVGDIELKLLGLSEAQAYLHRAYEVAGESVEVLAKYGEVLIRSGEVDKGRRLLQKVLTLVDDETNAHRRRSEVLLRICEEG